MNNRPPPYNPYIYNTNHDNTFQNVPSAPPMENYTDVSANYQIPVNGYIYSQPTYPREIYIPPNSGISNLSYIENAEIQRIREEERRRREDECCCCGILAFLCCCL
jgi:hypothetical protein